jgi:ribose-phosphate pyrophosphokinase
MNAISLFTFAHGGQHAADLASALSIPYSEIGVHRFPDGESRVTAPGATATSIVYCPLDRPNEKLVELMFASDALRRGGAGRLILVAPYLCYMRQDMAFHPGEVVSQQVIGGWLAELFDAVITVDPHLHRVTRLDEAVPAKQAITLSAAPAFVEYLRTQTLSGAALLLGPDSESEQWVRGIAEAAGLPYAIAQKQRQGDRSVVIRLPEAVSFEGRTVILLDDMASTGRTLIAAAEQAKARGAREIRVLVTHALFVNDSLEHLRRSPITHIGSSDSIPHETNVVRLDKLLAASSSSVVLAQSGRNALSTL